MLHMNYDFPQTHRMSVGISPEPTASPTGCDGRCFYDTGHTHLIIPIGYRTCSAVVVPQQQALTAKQSQLDEPLFSIPYMSIRIMVTLTLW